MSTLRNALCRYFEDRGKYDPEDFLFAYGDPRQALLAYGLFWPELTRVGGYVVLKSFADTPDSSNELLASLEDPVCDRQSLLAGYRWMALDLQFSSLTLGHHHVPRAFSDFGDDQLLCELMAHTWLGALRCFEPSKAWATRVVRPTESGSGWGVAFSEREDYP